MMKKLVFTKEFKQRDQGSKLVLGIIDMGQKGGAKLGRAVMLMLRCRRKN